MQTKKTSDIPTQEFLDNAIQILEEAHERNLTIRIIGSIAVMLHCKEVSDLYNHMNRKLTDIDYVGYGNKRKELIELIENHGFILDRRRAAAYSDRYIFESDRLHIDIFFDKISMCHVINFRNRLEVDKPTIPLAELVLEKMQIVKINEKDLKDISLVFLNHNVGNSDNEIINAAYIAKILSSDWGFYYTVNENLKLLKTYLKQFDYLSDSRKKIINERISSLLNRIDEEPKSTNWKLRARVGTRKKWYNDVEEVQR